MGSPGLCDVKVIERGVNKEDPLLFYFGDLKQRVEVQSEEQACLERSQGDYCLCISIVSASPGSKP